MSAARRYERPERALNVLERQRVDDFERRHASRRTLRVAWVNRWCVYISAYGNPADLRALYGEVRPGRAPLWSARHRAIVTVPETAQEMLDLATERRWPYVFVEEAQLVALAGTERAEENGLLW